MYYCFIDYSCSKTKRIIFKWTKDKENLIKKTFFGEEILPDFNVGKMIESQVTDEYCLWDEPINYELQVVWWKYAMNLHSWLNINWIINHILWCYFSIDEYSVAFFQVCLLLLLLMIMFKFPLFIIYRWSYCLVFSD